jgi:hypothetical protein
MAKRHEGRIALALLLLITIPMLTKVFTSDFGTHIAMGREIVRRMSIPDTEFLNYPSLGMGNTNGEWGFQAILYLVYAAGGVYGVSFLCWVVVFGVFSFIHRSTVLRGANPLFAVLAIFAFSGFLRIRIQPRPEIFTYLFIALTIYLFSEYYFGKRKRMIYLFPPTVLLWANMHPTYLMAFLLCGAFFADGLVRAAWNHQFRWGFLRSWVFPPAAVGVAGLLLCGLNPHGYEAILTPLHLISRGGSGGGSAVLMSISELTPVKGTGMYWYYQAAGIFAGFSLLIGLFGRRVYLLDLFLFAIAFKGAWDSARAVSMMGLFLSPGASLHLTGFLGRFTKESPDRNEGKGVVPAAPREKGKQKQKKSKKRKGETESPAPRKGADAVRPRLSSGRVAVVVAVVCALVAFGGATLSFSFSQLEYGVGLTEHKFSLAAAEFLRENPVTGKMFNFFDVGGFLDWQLYPQALTFIDGRTYNQQVFLEHQTVTGALPGWQEILRRYGVTYAILKTMDSSGMILPIIQTLTNDPGWDLVFADGLFVVFVRNTPETREYIDRHRIPKSMIPQQIIWESYHYMFLGVSPIVAFQTMSNMYDMMGNRQAAIESIRKALEYADEPFLRARLMQLQGGAVSPHR